MALQSQTKIAHTLNVMSSMGPGATDDVTLLSNTLATGPVVLR